MENEVTVAELIEFMTETVQNPRQKYFLAEVITNELVKMGIRADVATREVAKFYGAKLQ